VKKILFLFLFLFLVFGCATQQPLVIDLSSASAGEKTLNPNQPLPSHLFVLKIINGLSYKVTIRITDQDSPIILVSGESKQFRFRREHLARKVIITGQVYNGQQLIGTIVESIVISGKKGWYNQVDEDVWHITSFYKMKK